MKKLLILFAILIIGLAGNSLNAQTYVSGLISSNTNWTIGNHPYIVTGNILVNNGVTLTIEPGVIVKFNSGLSMQIDGELLAQGTINNKITFTSNTADTAGAWGYIYFSDASVDAVYENNIYGNYISGSILEYCIIQYAGGASVTNNGALRLDGAHPFVNYSTITDNSATGLSGFNLTGSLKITNSIISYNTSSAYPYGGGIYLYGQTPIIIISDNNIANNFATLGGGICVTVSGQVFILNNLISGNASDNGGGIYNSYGAYTPIVVSHNIIINNSANNNSGGISSGGGGINNEGNNAHTNISDNIIINNTSLSNGGGVFNFQGTVNLSNNVIADNFSTFLSGGFYSWGNATFVILNNHIVRNTANDAAGIDCIYSMGDIKSSTIAYNKNTDYLNILNRCVNIVANPIIITNNNIFNNFAFYELYNDVAQGSPNLDATNNWWGTANDVEIQAKIYDWFDDNSLGIVNYSPYLTAPDTAAPLSPPANAIKTDLGGGQVQITWLPNPESDVAGYHVYYGGFNGYSFTNVVNVGNINSYILSNVSFTDTIGLTAYDYTYSPANEYDSTIVNDNMTKGYESWFTFAVDTSTTGLTENNIEMPEEFTLYQNYPNPFNPSTIIRYSLPVTSQVLLKVYDVLGREVAILFNEEKSAGTHKVTFDGSGLASGIYYYQLRAGSFSESKKMILIK